MIESYDTFMSMKDTQYKIKHWQEFGSLLRKLMEKHIGSYYFGGWTLLLDN